MRSTAPLTRSLISLPRSNSFLTLSRVFALDAMSSRSYNPPSVSLWLVILPAESSSSASSTERCAFALASSAASEASSDFCNFLSAARRFVARRSCEARCARYSGPSSKSSSVCPALLPTGPEVDAPCELALA